MAKITTRTHQKSLSVNLLLVPQYYIIWVHYHITSLDFPEIMFVSRDVTPIYLPIMVSIVE